MIGDAASTPTSRRTPLDHRGFRTLLLVIAIPPIAAVYLWRTLILPALSGALPADFSANYLAAAARIASGHDPYDLCVIQGCGSAPGSFTPLPLAGAQYVTNPTGQLRGTWNDTTHSLVQQQQGAETTTAPATRSQANLLSRS